MNRTTRPKSVREKLRGLHQAFLSTGLILGVVLSTLVASIDAGEGDPPVAVDPQAERAPADPAGAMPGRPELLQTYEEDGITVRAEIVPLGDAAARTELRSGDQIEVRFAISDTTTGSPLAGLNPAAWIDPLESIDVDDTKERIRSYLTGSLSARASVDLNIFYVLALNPDGTISVVDPLFSYGGSRLLDMVVLPSPGEDWVLSEDGRDLWVSCPRANQIALVDTGTWKVTRSITVPTRPTRLALQPDEQYLWVSCPGLGDGLRSRVAVIDTAEKKLAETFEAGAGAHRFAFSKDSRHAYIGAMAAPRVTAFDTATLEPIQIHTPVGSLESLAFSTAGDALYWVDGTAGEIVAIADDTQQVRARIEVEEGVTELRFDPSGTRGILLDPVRGSVHILAAARNQIVQSGEVGPTPDQVSFTETLAYVRCAGSEIVQMLPLDALGREGPILMIDFPAGHVPFGLATSPSPAAGIVAAPSGAAVLVANPIDQAIYFYSEGMAAPMGEFQNYGQEPRAVLVVDRSLNERAPGVYSTRVTLERGGPHGIFFLLDYPSLHTRFLLDIAPAFEPLTEVEETRVTMRRVVRGDVYAGEPLTVEIDIRDERGIPIGGLDDVGMMAMRSSIWQLRGLAKVATDTEAGVYRWTFTPPTDGVYFVHARTPSRSITFTDVPKLTVQVLPKREAPDAIQGR